VREAIAAAIAAVRRYNERLLQGSSWLEQFAPGVVLGEKSTPIDRVGLYVPCGKGSFPSVLVQIATPAVVAGVREIAVVLPPLAGQGKQVDPAVLVVAEQLGLREIYRSNGPAGVAALAVGTATIPRVRKIAGPGSPAVTAAQILAQLEGVEVAMLFGPSECLILADESADPRRLAADYLNEAEHGNDSAALLVTPSRALVEAVAREVEVQLAALPEWRRAYAMSATTNYGGAIIVRDMDEGIAFANEYAPEHMQVATRDPLFVLSKLEHAGEILLGQDTPISAANFAIGVPATLPTGGFAKVSSAVSAHTFRKRSSVAYLNREALAGMANTVLALAEHEGFPQHAASIHVRGL
jgi:histidinol dehydrogenase